MDFDLDGYGIYVYSAYGATAILLIAAFVRSYLSYRKLRKAFGKNEHVN